ncbi:MAG: heme ABC exporter ATP-binding protein CcmA [Candidatus Binatia bacterium]
MSATVLDTRGLTRRFAGVTALASLDLTVGAGEAVAVLGPNGAGKSTLLRLLATLLRPSDGTLRLFDRAVSEGSARARRRIGLLSHQSLLYPDLTPMENLEFYARMFGVSPVTTRVRTLLNQVGLTGWAHRPVRTLSRGLEQRCALARALVHEPDLLLLDEPFTGLDSAAAARLSAMLSQAHSRGTTLLMTTHDIGHAFALCQRAIILTHGRLVWDGTLVAAERSAFERRYRAIARGGRIPDADFAPCGKT